MIKAEENPSFVNSFLDYCLTYQNKSPNSVEQYNADLIMFLKYMKYHFHLSNETDFAKIQLIEDVDLQLVQEKFQQLEFFINI